MAIGSSFDKVTNSLQQLYNGGGHKGGGSSSIHGNSSHVTAQPQHYSRGTPTTQSNGQAITQKQTKSKARMIRNILHTSNFNTEKKRNL